jgi:hypothetical protein
VLAGAVAAAFDAGAVVFVLGFIALLPVAVLFAAGAPHPVKPAAIPTLRVMIDNDFMFSLPKEKFQSNDLQWNFFQASGFRN